MQHQESTKPSLPNTNTHADAVMPRPEDHFLHDAPLPGASHSCAWVNTALDYACHLSLEAKAGSPAAKMLGLRVASALWTWLFRMFWGEKAPRRQPVLL